MGTAVIALILAIGLPGDQAVDPKAPEYGKFVVVPLRAHILTSRNIPQLDCKLASDAVTRIIEKVNTLWHKAGVHFGLESVIREPASQEERFRLTAELRPNDLNAGQYRMLMPRSSRALDCLNVYFFGDLPCNSSFLGDDTIAVQQAPRLQPVLGGCDDPIARVTAHALGHALGLPIHAEEINLMAGGTEGIALTIEQTDAAHKVARTLPGASTVADLRKAAESAETKGKDAEAGRFWSWLAEIPGAGAAEAKRRSTALQQKALPEGGARPARGNRNSR